MKALLERQTACEANEPEKCAPVAARLRALAREHGEGQLSLDAYRKLRAALIDTLDADTPDLQSSTIPRPESRVRGTLTTASLPAPSEAVPVAPEKPRRGRFARMLAWMAGALGR